MDDKILNSIIKVAYGEASFLEKLKIRKLAKGNSEISSLLEKHIQIANASRNLGTDAFPEEILKNVKNITRVSSPKEKSLFFDIYSFIFMRPAISAAIFSVIILSLISTFVFKRPEIHQQYSKQEIELADQQVKQSLALLASVFKRTTTTVEKDILNDRVSRPIKESFNLVNEYLEEDNNENIN
ncbi:MAG: hypothetical protein R3250_01580 [Melioribacteraceae bacterium]|nr:hypothetical protein [Melioribacteraceae bacterium]